MYEEYEQTGFKHNNRLQKAVNRQGVCHEMLIMGIPDDDGRGRTVNWE